MSDEKMVPRESTEQMVAAGRQAWMKFNAEGVPGTSVTAVWYAMWQAAPARPADDPVRAALVELVACKDLKERRDAIHDPAPVPGSAWGNLHDEYERRQPLAWAAARAALALPSAGGQINAAASSSSPGQRPDACRANQLEADAAAPTQQAERDAARYRWLLNRGWYPQQYAPKDRSLDFDDAAFYEAIGVAIDAAMQTEKGRDHGDVLPK